MDEIETDNHIYENQQHPQPKAIGQYILPIAGTRSQPRSKRSGVNSERAELVGWFTDRLNEARRGTKFKPLAYRSVGVKLAHLRRVSDLYYLRTVCLDAERRGIPFSAAFWSALKPTQKQPNL
jgi:hypothetical protein